MQTTVNNGKIIANGIAYIVPIVKNGTQVEVTLNRFSGKFCLVNYKDSKGIPYSYQAVAESVLPNNVVDMTTKALSGKKRLTAVEKRIARMMRNNSAEDVALLQKSGIVERCYISQEQYKKIVRQLKLGDSLIASAKSVGLTRETTKKYRDIYLAIKRAGCELLIAHNGSVTIKRENNEK